MELLLHCLEELEARPNDDTPSATTLLQSTRDELENIFKLEAEGAAIRSRAKYKLDGEKATKLFCNLEKYNGSQKFIPHIIKHVDGAPVVLTKQSDIEEETKLFYESLYSNQDHIITETIDSFLGTSEESLVSQSVGQYVRTYNAGRNDTVPEKN